MTCPPWAVILVAAAAAAMLAMGPLLGAAASADGVPVLILKINQLLIKVGATIQVPRTTILGTWSHPICKEEMGADVVVADLVEVWMMVPLNGEDPNPNIQAQPLQDLQAAPTGEICLIPTAKFVDLLVPPDPVLVVPLSQMDPSGLVVPQEEGVAVGVMTYPMAKWATAAAVVTLPEAAGVADGVILTPEKNHLSGPTAALAVGTGVPDTPWALPMGVCIALVPDGVLTIPLTRLMDPQDGLQTTQVSKPLVDPKSPQALQLMIWGLI